MVMNSRLAFGRVLFLVVALLLSCVQTQSDCTSSTIILNAATNTETIYMTCSVDADLVLTESLPFQWAWEKITHDERTLEVITDGLVEERNGSIYTLNIQCNDSGLYRAVYMNQMGDCLFHCIFILQEVLELRPEVLTTAFSKYPNFDGAVSFNITGRESTDSRVGTCGDKFYLDSSCVVRVSGIWYRNGTLFDPRADTQNYIVLSSGELLISNLTDSIVGYYVCVTTVHDLGRSYLTVQTDIVISPSIISAPTTAEHIPTTTDLTVVDNLNRRLTVWQIGLIIGVATLVITAILMTGVVCMGYMTIKRRRDINSQVRYKKKTRPKSMMEQIHLLEEAEMETVDFGGPINVPFNSILFEELLHKGTFKVVHHGTVNEPVHGHLSIPVAVKRLKDEKSELGYEELMNEIYMLRALQEKGESHPNIVSLFGLTVQGGPTCLLLEYVPNGTLDNFLESLKIGPVPEWYLNFVRDTLRGAYHKHVAGDLMNIIMQVSEGMKFLTDQGLIHRDLSTRNILIGERLNVKISNPGMHHEGYYYVISEREHFLQDMAPECLWEKCYSVCSDVWSFGIFVYRTVTLNSVPFPDLEVNKLHGRMVGGERPQLLASFSNEFYFLLQRCWLFVATERPDFATIISDLIHMAKKPTQHILLKVSKDEGYVSGNGQVYLCSLPLYTLEAPQKKSKRTSGTMRSLISSIDDTVYTRETVETILDSENDNDNYEQYLKGDLPVPPHAPPERTVKRRSYDETDTSGNDGNTKTREWVKATTRKVKGGDGATSGKGKKKKRRTSTNTSREKKQPGSAGVKEKTTENKTSKSSLKMEVEDSGELSSDEAPSITEEEKERGTSELSASEGAVSLVGL